MKICCTSERLQVPMEILIASLKVDVTSFTKREFDETSAPPLLNINDLKWRLNGFYPIL